MSPGPSTPTSRHSPQSGDAAEQGSLADAVLPLIRTRNDLHRLRAANAHGSQMHRAIDALEAAIPDADPDEAYAVAHKALASAVKVIARADDSSGVIGDACRRLLALHPTLAAAARVSARRLIDWMMKFQFDGDIDYFELDPVAYAPALGPDGVAAYRDRLEEKRAEIGPLPAGSDLFRAPHRHERWVLDWNDRRLAVLDRDVEAIIRTHSQDQKVSAWFTDTAEALAEIGEFDLAIEWARKAMYFDGGHQSQQGARYWLGLLRQHHPEHSVEASLEVFRRWPTSGSAGQLYRELGQRWSEHNDEVLTTLRSRPSDAIDFMLSTLDDVQGAWDLAHELNLTDGYTWEALAGAYARIDPVAVLPVYQALVEDHLSVADHKHYRTAAKLLVTMRELAAGSEKAGWVDDLIAALRDEHRRRPRLQQEFDRAGLP